MKLENCIVHKMIIAKASEHMEQHGKFFKDVVLQETPFVSYPSYVQWGYVRKTLEEKCGPLVPILHDDDRFDPSIDPERFIPGGRKRADGYAKPSAIEERVALTYAGRRHANGVGTWRGIDRLMATFQEQGLPVSYTPTALPALSFTPPPAG